MEDVIASGGNYNFDEWNGNGGNNGVEIGNDNNEWFFSSTKNKIMTWFCHF